MGQTLTNGIYLPAEGERNCYEGLAANWTALDGLVGGYNAHIGNTTIHVTAADKQAWDGHVADSVKHVTAEDKAKWDAVTSKANDSDVVHKSGDETKSGELTLSDTLNSSDVVPRSNNTYSSGSSNNQWNNIYSKNYYYNGVAWGLNEANQWSANNKFTGNVSITKNSDSPTASSDTSLALTGTSQYIFFRTKGSSNYKSYNSFLWGGYLNGAFPYRFGRIRLYRASAVYGETGEETPDTSFSFIDVALHYKWVSLTDNVKFINDQTTNACAPLTNNATDLGTPTNKWKSFNGLEPSSLGMPNLSVGVDISGYITNLNKGVNTYTPPANGWINIRIRKTSLIHTSLMIYQTNGLLSSCEADEYNISGTNLPVIANQNVDIYIYADALVEAKFYPCQGNL